MRFPRLVPLAGIVLLTAAGCVVTEPSDTQHAQASGAVQHPSAQAGSGRAGPAGDSEHQNIAQDRIANVGRFDLESVGMGKITDVGLGYTRNVGVAMISVVGVTRVDVVGKTWSIAAGEKIEFRVGSSRLTLTPDAIHLSAKDIYLTTDDQVRLDAPEILRLNDGSAEPASDLNG